MEEYNQEAVDAFANKGRPIPGQSLTANPDEPRPFEGPPDFVNFKEALDFIASELLLEENYMPMMAAIADGVPITDLAMQDAIFYTNLILLLLVVFLGSFIIFLIYRTLQTEKKRKQYTPTMKQGDKVYTPVMSGNVKGEILDVTEDKVTMVIEVPKSRVYPNE